MITAPSPSKRAATSVVSKAVADNADSDTGPANRFADRFFEAEENEVELIPEEVQNAI